jgi:SAM-dependent methyltransferase
MILSHRASDDWKRYGKEDPYFGVLSDARYRGRELNDDLRNEFFTSGRQHVETIVQVLRETFGDVPRGTALDFGCGVGRLSQPMASVFDHVIGADVSDGMLSEARKNASLADIRNVEYRNSSNLDWLQPRSFDLVHSYIVFQHIPVETGEPIIAKLIDAVKEGGIGALHITIVPAQKRLRAAIRNGIKRNRLSRIVGNVAVGRPWNAPAMEMNLYRTERIIEMLVRSGIERFSCIRVDDWGSEGLFFLFKRQLGEGSKSPWSNPSEAE